MCLLLACAHRLVALLLLYSTPRAPSPIPIFLPDGGFVAVAVVAAAAGPDDARSLPFGGPLKGGGDKAAGMKGGRGASEP